MKTKTKLKLHLLCLAILGASALAHAQGTAFTYQGRLNENNAPASGNYDLRFAIYDSIGGPTMVAGPLTNSAVAVSNGLFAVTLDFGTGVFSGPARWLDIAVRTNGNGTFTALDLRQALMPSPYAIFANTASNVVSGSVVKSLNNLKDNVTLAAGSNVTITPSGNTLTIASAGVGGAGIWSVNANNTYYNAGNVGIGTTTPSAYGHGGTARILEVNNSNTTANSQAHLMLFSGVNSLLDSAMGTVTWAQPGGMAAYIGAQTRSTTPNSPAAMLSFGTRKIGDGAASPKMVITEDGNVGIGTTTPTPGIRLEVIGAALLKPGNGNIQFGSPNGELGYSIIPTANNSRADLRFDGSVLKLVAGAGTGPPAAANGIAINTSGNVGIGTTNPSANMTMLVQAHSENNFPFFVNDSYGNPLFSLACGAANNNNLGMYGNASKNAGGSAWSVFSDRRLKQDVRAYEAGLDEVLQLRPVRFRYRDDPRRGLTSTHEEVGFIAQEVREVIPDAVTEGKDGYLSLKADPIHWAAINAIQELNAKLVETRAVNAALKQRLEKLEQLVNQNNRGVR